MAHAQEQLSNNRTNMNEQMQKPKTKNELVAWRLCNMASYAKELQNFDHAALAARGKYIRIQGESVRLISIDPKTPLCKLQIDGVDLGKSKSVSELVRNIDASQQLESSRKPGEERAMQAYIIKAALVKNRSLSSLFPGLNEYGIDELIFICDELSVGDKNTEDQGATCRADLIALGKKDGICFPVFIELKYFRALGRLVEQLDNIQNEMSKPDVSPSFLKLLSAVSGVPTDAIDLGRAKRMVVWPRPEGKESARVSAAIKENVIFVEYKPPSEDYSFKCHKTAVEIYCADAN
jgi:hypothetical protein